MTARFADFFDGRRAVPRRVSYAFDIASGALTIETAEGETLQWPLADLRAIRDQADADTLVVTLVTDPLARLILTDANMIRTVTAHAPKLAKPPPVRGLRRVVLWGASAVTSVVVIVFVLVPLLADQLARVLPPGGEVALGEATLGQIQSALGSDMGGLVPLCDAPEGRAAMDRMTDRLVTDDLGLPYDVTVTILDHPMVNAFALPGGQVVFFRGLIQAATHPDQVAAVLAHEIGHVAARDPTRIALRSAGSLGVLGLLFGDFAGGAAVLFLVEQLIRADYTQEAEAAADTFAIEMMLAARIDPGALGDLFEVLRDEHGDVTGIARHFLSHPALGDRIAAAREAALAAGPTTPALDPAGWAALRAACQ